MKATRTITLEVDMVRWAQGFGTSEEDETERDFADRVDEIIETGIREHLHSEGIPACLVTFIEERATFEVTESFDTGRGE